MYNRYHVTLIITLFSEIIDRVRSVTHVPSFRPSVRQLQCDSYIIDCMNQCWCEVPDERPDFRTVRKSLEPLRSGM